jgi:hypothetical protein
MIVPDCDDDRGVRRMGWGLVKKLAAEIDKFHGLSPFYLGVSEMLQLLLLDAV